MYNEERHRNFDSCTSDVKLNLIISNNQISISRRNVQKWSMSLTESTLKQLMEYQTVSIGWIIEAFSKISWHEIKLPTSRTKNFSQLMSFVVNWHGSESESFEHGKRDKWLPCYLWADGLAIFFIEIANFRQCKEATFDVSAALPNFSSAFNVIADSWLRSYWRFDEYKKCNGKIISNILH